MQMRKGTRVAPRSAAPVANTIKSLDSDAHTVTLESGKVWHCATTVDLAKFKAGDVVTMTFADKNGTAECAAMSCAA
ncbi:MAG: DUF1344 domain-containing protein [Rhodobacteraceae bacterium]|nr:DUF1344 domain-containing protein [Paracoccaceae bacterium]